MTIFIDEPTWPAHDAVWSHLVSDSTYNELHRFAKQLGLPRRSFDLDHYDVPASFYSKAISLGAVAVEGRKIVLALQKSGLRVRQIDQNAVIPIRRLEYLREEWHRLGAVLEIPQNLNGRNWLSEWSDKGEDLLHRWAEPHRHYHNLKHLEEVLLALDQLSVYGETVTAPTLLGAWFHDAIYLGSAGQDEIQSANFAAHTLLDLGFDTRLSNHVQELVIATDPAKAGYEYRQDPEFANLLDSDIWVFASQPDRYQEYTRDIRAEYAEMSTEDFDDGRVKILRSFLAKPSLYLSSSARRRWEPGARRNVSYEIKTLDL